MFAARSQHIKHVIEPALRSGSWVLCDRFTDATFAYQGGGRDLSAQAIGWLENFVQGSLRPDLTLLLDAPIEIGMARARLRADLDRIESETLHFFERVRRSYLVQANLHPERIKVIKADLPLTDVQIQISQILKPLTAHES